jgi:hypothetical protein
LNVGGIFDHRRWAFPSELVRLPVTAAALALSLPREPSLVAGQLGLALTAGALLIWLFLYRRQFDGSPQALSRVLAPHDRFDHGALTVAQPNESDPSFLGNRAATS